MARILGVEIPNHKRLEISLTYIYGIGKKTAQTILEKLHIDCNKTISDLTQEELKAILHEITTTYTVEGELRKFFMLSIKKLMDIGCYRGIRHRTNKTVRGQRTKNNCRTKKGPRKNAIRKFKKVSFKKPGTAKSA